MLVVSWLTTLGCGGNSVDLGHGQSRGWADAPAGNASTTAPQTVYESEERMFGWALDDATLYALLDHGTSFELVSCPLERCRSERTVLYSGPKLGAEGAWYSALVLVDGWLLWSVPGGVLEGVAGCPVTGCDKPSFVASDFDGGPPYLAADGAYVYWVDVARSLQRLGAGQETAERVRSLETGQTGRLEVHGDFAYFADAGGTTISRARVDGSGDVEVVATDNRINGLAVASDSFYYPTQILTGQILECPLSGCTVQNSVLAANQRWPAAVRVVDDEAFWLISRTSSPATSASLESCKLPDCASVKEWVNDFPSTTNSSPTSGDDAHPFAVNRDSLVWAETYHGFGSALRRLAR